MGYLQTVDYLSCTESFWNFESTVFKNSGLRLPVKNPNPLPTPIPQPRKSRAAALCRWDPHSRTFNAYTRPLGWPTVSDIWVCSPWVKQREKKYYLNTSWKYATHSPTWHRWNTNRFRVNPCSINPKSLVKEGLGYIRNIFEPGIIKGNFLVVKDQMPSGPIISRMWQACNLYMLFCKSRVCETAKNRFSFM